MFCQLVGTVRAGIQDTEHRYTGQSIAQQLQFLVVVVGLHCYTPVPPHTSAAREVCSENAQVPTTLIGNGRKALAKKQCAQVVCPNKISSCTSSCCPIRGWCGVFCADHVDHRREREQPYLTLTKKLEPVFAQVQVLARRGPPLETLACGECGPESRTASPSLSLSRCVSCLWLPSE